MQDGNEKYKQMYSELEKYEKHGIGITIDGNPASPMQIVNAHMMIHENVSYMRDYVMDSNGNLEEIRFQEIRQSK